MVTLFKKDLEKRIAISYNIVWPIAEFAVDALKNTDFSFVCGEHTLFSCSEERKADGAILFQSSIEICLLEVSGKYKLNDISRVSYDHVKGCFGVLTMLNAIIKKYYKATIHTSMTLKSLFLHARGECIFLWSLEICHNKLYAFQKVYQTKVPLSFQYNLMMRPILYPASE
ncbi:hypothetical protein BCV72DRAFT_12638 [Rhizopus microsporus var. microsporus]|uniref:Uncharacterized protein n=2 Tax=Rhizopus microsporus TaxID=58291 RepID=A0A2G4SM12_RHIZD|nr:uncharacterized protein RHIMIDRAFT_46774 [Rhizopus microsporus ATCC 52813]ORE04596.1 hypothetical protein BCV72DRAFT_12638 [Rhizopus microsporus var. microsporus]PHZ09827.1 hypothetical protein RHIMIDRAFT_46774 [Rhizopus microsporus ATCC 52813]